MFIYPNNLRNSWLNNYSRTCLPSRLSRACGVWSVDGWSSIIASLSHLDIWALVEKFVHYSIDHRIYLCGMCPKHIWTHLFHYWCYVVSVYWTVRENPIVPFPLESFNIYPSNIYGFLSMDFPVILQRTTDSLSSFRCLAPITMRWCSCVYV